MGKPPVRAQELATALATEIRRGVYPAGSWLPPERQLAEAFSVARSTVRSAIQVLASTGLVEVVPASGVQVRLEESAEGTTTTPREIDADLRRIYDLLGEMNARLIKIQEGTRSGA